MKTMFRVVFVPDSRTYAWCKRLSSRRRGQRIRLQVSSGAHPRFVRNPGTGEPLATATKLQVAEQSVYHDPEHPSAILLPVIKV